MANGIRCAIRQLKELKVVLLPSLKIIKDIPNLMTCARLAGLDTVAWLLAVAVLAYCPFAHPSAEAQQEVKVWEYAPYEVQLWYSFHPSIAQSPQARQWLLETMKDELTRTFRATWNLRLNPAPGYLFSGVAQPCSSVSIKEMARRDIVLVVSTTNPETHNLRTFQAAADNLTAVAASSATRHTLSTAAREYDLSQDASSTKLLEKMSEQYSTDDEILRSFADSTIAAAFLPRHQAEQMEKARILPTLFAWQTESLLSLCDKLFLLSIEMEGDQYRMRACEVDCPMQYAGPERQATCHSWSETPAVASFLVRQAFAPIARVEGAESASAELRHRAGGLMTDEDSQNPSRIHVGDVMHPIIRRDDRSGNPTLLQALDFTYATITASDGVKMQANVYTYSGGPGLRGRQNPRTHRVLLKVRPQSQQSDLKMVVRGNTQQSQPGCFVYVKDHLTDEFTYLGRTDWRGHLTIAAPNEQLAVLSADLKAQKVAAVREARAAILAQARKEHDELVSRASAEGKDLPEFIPPVYELEEEAIDPSNLIPLSTPLLQLYVKNGDTVLARLPFVPGANPVAVAELPDDSLRLHSEALVRGFQGEILDLIGQRNLLAARVRMYVQNQNLDRARTTMDQLQGLKDFNQMNDELSNLQRSILEQTTTSIPRSAQSQIDRMFTTTRDLLQKYLQMDIVGDTARLLREASQ